LGQLEWRNLTGSARLGQLDEARAIETVRRKRIGPGKANPDFPICTNPKTVHCDKVPSIEIAAAAFPGHDGQGSGDKQICAYRIWHFRRLLLGSIMTTPRLFTFQIIAYSAFLVGELALSL
jgi:hypothetical protein